MVKTPKKIFHRPYCRPYRKDIRSSYRYGSVVADYAKILFFFFFITLKPRVE
jgi:hypothetical protein